MKMIKFLVLCNIIFQANFLWANERLLSDQTNILTSESLSFPTEISATRSSYTMIQLSWSAVSYTNAEGNYEIWCSTSENGNYTKYAETINTTIENFTLLNLSETSDYYIRLRTIIYLNDQTLQSEFSPLVISKTFTDNESINLTLQAPEEATEGDDLLSQSGFISISGTLKNDLRIHLYSSDTSEATMLSVVTIPSGFTNTTFDIYIVNDEIIDGDQQTTITVSAPGFYSSSAILKVHDNDPGVFQLPSQFFSVDRHHHIAAVPVIRTPMTSGVVTVDYETYGETAVDGLDFIAESGTLTFQNDEYIKLITMNILDNFQSMGNIIHVDIFNPGGGASIEPEKDQALLTIQNIELIALPYTLVDSEGIEWTITNNGSIEKDSSNGAIHGGFESFPNAILEGDQQVIIGPTIQNDIEITRKIFIPKNHEYARFLEIVKNVGSEEVQYNVNITNFDKLHDINTSSGDYNFSTEDIGYVTDGAFRLCIYGNDLNRPCESHSSYNSESYHSELSYTYCLSLLPAQTQIVMHFISQSQNFSTIYYLIDQVFNLKPDVIELLTNAELQQILNFTTQADEVDKLFIIIIDNVFEHSGMIHDYGRISIDKPAANNLQVFLTCSNEETIDLPSSVMIYAGYTATAFNINIIDNNIVDGQKSVIIAAHASGYEYDMKMITIGDDEHTRISLEIPSTIDENDGIISNAGYVSIDQALNQDVYLFIHSSDETRLIVPDTVFIQKGETESYFDMMVIEDQIIKNPDTITITAKVSGWISGVTTTIVYDNTPKELFITLPEYATEGEVKMYTGMITTGDYYAENDVYVELISSDLSEIVVPGLLTIPAGSKSITFHVTIVDDPYIDFAKQSTVTARSDDWISSSDTIKVFDNDNVIHLSIPHAIEGQLYTGTVFVEKLDSPELVIKLTATNFNDLTIPSSISLYDDLTKTSFNFFIADNTLLDGTRQPIITASSPDWISTSSTLMIYDNEVATISLTSPHIVQEGNPYNYQAAIKVDRPVDREVSFIVKSSDTTELMVPDSVIMPEGYTTIEFNVQVVDDTIYDGTQTAYISASVTGWNMGEVSVEIQDNPYLTLQLPDDVSELDGTRNNAKVSISEETDFDVSVQLITNDISELVVPNSVTISAGSLFSYFTLTVINDHIDDGRQSVVIVADATGWKSHNSTILVVERGLDTGLEGVDMGINGIPIGFSFNYWGIEYQTFGVSTHGFIGLSNNADETYHNTNFPNPGGRDGIIAPFFDDIIMSKNYYQKGKVFYQTLGIAPNRILVIQYNNVFFYINDKRLGTFETILFENTNQIKFQYRYLYNEASYGNSATIGIDQPEGYSYVSFSYNESKLKEQMAILFTPDESSGYIMDDQAPYEWIDISGYPIQAPTDNGDYASDRIIFKWRPQSDTSSYILEISTSLFENDIFDTIALTNITSYTYESNLVEGKTYFARISTPINDENTYYDLSDFSDGIIIDQTPPEIHQPSVSEGDQITIARFQFRAEDNYSLQSFHIQISVNDPDFTTTALDTKIDTNISGTDYSLYYEYPGTPGTTVYARAYAVDLAGNKSEYSNHSEAYRIPFSGLIISKILPSTSYCDGDAITITGQNFGLQQGKVLIGDAEMTSYTLWTETDIICNLPDLQPGTYDITVIRSDNTQSIFPNAYTEVGAHLMVNTDTLDFGNVYEEFAESQWLILTNTGNSELSIFSISLSGTNQDMFSINNHTCSQTISPSQSCSLSITFTPSVDGQQYLIVLIHSNNCNMPTRKVILHGVGLKHPRMKEREALIALYNSINGDQWKDNSGWLGPIGTECNWHGVLCDKYKIIKELHLEDNQLRGNIPEQIGNLANLSWLNLSNNHLNGNIPEQIQNLNKTEFVDFSYNCLYTEHIDIVDYIGGKGWEKTQTTAPKNITATTLSYTQIHLSWDAIPYTENEGNYEIWYSTPGSEAFTIVGRTTDKQDASLILQNLSICTNHLIKIKTVTKIEDIIWESDFSHEIQVNSIPVNFSIVLHHDAYEGDGLINDIGTIHLPAEVASDLTINLSIFDPSQQDFVFQDIVIPKGHSSVDFSFLVFDDTLIDGSQYINIQATASGCNPATNGFWVHDNEQLALFLNIPSNVVEGEGTITGEIFVYTPVDMDVSVSISTNYSQEIILPSNVTIHKGSLSNTFNLTINDNSFIDGLKTANITASVIGWESASQSITITDNESLDILVQVPVYGTEGDGILQSGLVSISGMLNEDLTINLSSSDTTEVTHIPSLTIPQGMTSVSFDIVIINDEIIDGNQQVQIIASAPDFYSGISLITIKDNDPGEIQFPLSIFSVEQDQTMIAVPVIRSPESSGLISVDYETSDYTAYSGIDYIANSGSLTFHDGEYIKLITLKILDSFESTGNTFHLNLTNPGGGSSIGIDHCLVIIKNYKQISLPYSLVDSQNNYWSIQENGRFEISYADGFIHNGFYDFSKALLEGDQQIIIGPAHIGNIEITRKIFIPKNHTYVRCLEIIHNNGNEATSYELKIENYDYMDIQETSSGDKIVSTEDNWIITSGNINLFLIYDNSINVRPSSLYYKNYSYSQDELHYNYNFLLNPDDTIIVMHYIAKTYPEQMSAADQLKSIKNDSMALLTDFEQRRIRNFNNEYRTGTYLDLSISEVISEDSGLVLNYGMVTIQEPLAEDLKIYLISNVTDKIYIDQTATIQAGYTNTQFDVNIEDNEILDGTQSVAIIAYAPGYDYAAKHVDISDNETATLSINLPSSVTETNQIIYDACLISTDRPLEADTFLQLTSSDENTIVLPDTVLFEQGEMEIYVDFQIIDDEQIEEPKMITITASSLGWFSGKGTIIVYDNEHKKLSISVPEIMREGDNTIENGTIEIEGFYENNIVVELVSSDVSEVSVPSFITIPAGESSIDFNFTIIDDDLVDFVEQSIITASAPSWISCSKTVIVNDNDNYLYLQLPKAVYEGRHYTGTVFTKGFIDIEKDIQLNCSSPFDLTIPSTVRVPTNFTQITFEIKTNDDDLLEGTQEVNIFASASDMHSYSSIVSIYDNERTNITLKLPITAKEGDGLIENGASIIVDHPVDEAVLFLLKSDDLTELTVPDTVEMPAGNTTVTFSITIVDDTILDGTQTASASALVTGWNMGVADIEIQDNPYLSLSIPDDAAEIDGILTNQGTLYISEYSELDTIVHLESNDISELIVPETLIIPEGSLSIPFDLTVIDDNIIDGRQYVTISASVPGWETAHRAISIVERGNDTNLKYDDNRSELFPIGFTFNYWGEDCETFSVSTNGFISLNTYATTEYTNYDFPDPNYQDGIIAPFFDDLRMDVSGQPTGKVYYQTLGHAPNRMLVIQFHDVYFYGSNLPMGTFETILFENTNQIKFQYRYLRTERSFGKEATIGLDKPETDEFIRFSYNESQLREQMAILFTPNDSGSYTMNEQAYYTWVDISGFTNTAPSDGGAFASDAIQFNWLPVTSANAYLLEIFTSLNVDDIIDSITLGNVTTFFYTSNLIEEQTYYARISASLNNGGTFQNPSDFSDGITIDQTSPTIDQPTVSLGDQESTVRFHFSGTDNNFISSYRIQIMEDSPDFSSPVVDKKIISDYYDYHGTPRKNVFARAYAIDAAGNISDFSESSDAFIVPIPSPKIYDIVPISSYCNETELRIAGEFFEWDQGVVKIDHAEAVAYTSWTDTEIVCKIPEQPPGNYDITILRSDGISRVIPNSYTMIGADLTLDYDLYEFGSVYLHQMSSQRIVLSNMGNSDLAINSISITGTNEENFSIDQNCTMQQISPTQSCPLTIAFMPGDYGRKEAFLVILSNDYETTIQTFPLLGFGVNGDLEVVDCSIPYSAFTGESISIAWAVKNSGLYTIENFWYDAFYLSHDQIIDDNDSLIVDIIQEKILEPSASYTQNERVQLSGIGNYWVYIKTNKDNIIFEMTQNTNSKFCGPIEIKAHNLAVKEINIPESEMTWESIEIQWLIKNENATLITGIWKDCIYLSDDNQIGNDIELTCFDRPEQLGPNETYLQTQTLQIPTNIWGKFSVIVKTDASDMLMESNEIDNVMISGTLPLLFLSIHIPEYAIEGNGILAEKGIIQTSLSSSEPITIALQSGDETEVIIPTTVVIPAGLTQVSFDINVLEDMEIDYTQTVEVSASISGIVSNFVNKTIQIYDNDKRTLTIELPEYMMEGAGVFRDAGKLKTSGIIISDLIVNLTSSNNSSIHPETSVTISAGYSSASFDIFVEDDDLINGNQTISIQADSPGWFSGTGIITLYDNEPTQLYMKINRPLYENDGFTNNAGRVFLSGKTMSDLTINLISGDTSRVISQSLTIAEGYTSTNFALTTIDNALINGSQYVMITATALNYTPASTEILIHDNEQASLSVNVPNRLSETNSNIIGQSYVFCNHRVDNDVTIHLATNDESRLSVPESIVIPKGLTSVVFDLYTHDNDIIDGNQQIAITASVEGWYTGVGWIEVQDDENRNLTIDSPWQTTFNEETAIYDDYIQVKLSGVYESDLIIYLNNSDPSELTLQNSVTIPSGETTVYLDMIVNNDEFIDGNQSVTITAASPGWITDTLIIDIIDDENKQINLTIPDNINENQGYINNFGTISISGFLLYDLRFQLTASAPTELTIPETIVIPAGERSTSFSATIIDDPLYDGSQSVEIKASAINFLPDEKTIVIHDSEAASLTLTLPLELIEGEENVAYVSMNSIADKDICVKLIASNQEITIPENVTIAKGYTFASFQVHANDDNFIDGSQPSQITASVNNWHSGTGQLLVHDNEPKELNLTFYDPDIVVEGDGILSQKGKVSIPGITVEDIVVYLTSSDTTEVTVAESIIIQQGTDLTEFDIYLPDDDIVDSAQTITITVSASEWISDANQLTVFDNEMIYITTEDNENNDHEGIPDYDVGDCINRFSDKHPIEFNIDVKKNHLVSSVFLSLFILDIDFPDEVDDIYINNHKLGFAIGENDINYSTLFIIPDSSWIHTGNNLIEILVDRDHIFTKWCANVQSGQLIFNEALNVGTATIKSAHSDSSDYTYGNSATIDIELITTLPSQYVRLELLLRNPQGKILKFDKNSQIRNYLIQKGADNQYRWNFSIPTSSDNKIQPEDLIDGIWAVNISVYDLTTQLFQCTKTITFSVPYGAEKQPSLLSISPNSGDIFEAKAVLITGTNFIENETTCKLGGHGIANQNIVNNTQITGNISDSLSPGTYDLICQTPYGTAPLANAYTVFAPLISLSEQNIFFDKTYVNHHSETGIIVTNAGNKALSISQAILSETTHYQLKNDLCANHVLNPSESCHITLTFTPATDGRHQTELSIGSNDPYSSVATIGIQGTGVLFDLALQDCALPYTTIAGESMAITWVVRNTGVYTTTGNQTHTIYVSSDNQPGNDIPVTVLETTTMLATEMSYTHYTHIDFPDHLIGNQWIIFHVDPSNPDIEMSEINNIRLCGPVQILDKTPPTTNFSANGTVFFDGTNYYAKKGVQCRLSAQDMYGSVQTIEYQVNNSLFQTYIEEFTLITDGIHTISFRARDNSGNWETLNTIIVKVEIPPAIPEGLTGDHVESAIHLKWLPNDEADLSHYNLYQNQENIDEVYPSGNDDQIYILANIQTNNIYTYQISAVNKIGLESSLSAPISVSSYPGLFVMTAPKDGVYVIDNQISIVGVKKANVSVDIYVNAQFQQSSDTIGGLFEMTHIMLAEGENTITAIATDTESLYQEVLEPVTIYYIKRPRAPENLIAIPDDTIIKLHWEDPNETDIEGYYIYRNNERLLYQFAPISQTSFTDTRLSNGITYTYAVTCIDSKYIESRQSNAIRVKPIAGDWKIHTKRKKRSLQQIETINLTAPSQNNAITIDIINNRSPLISRKFTVTASSDDLIHFTDGITKKKRIKAGEEHTLVFTFEINCTEQNQNQLINFLIVDESGYETTITKRLSIRSTLNKCQSCSENQIVSVTCPAKDCLISMGCHPSSGCKYIPEESVQCNIDMGQSSHVHFIEENLCQTLPAHFFSPYTSPGLKDKLPIEITLNEASNISVGIYKTNGDWVTSLMHQQDMSSGKFVVEWDGQAADGSNMENGLYHLIITKDDQITREHIHIDNEYPDIQINRIIQQTEEYIEIYGTASDPNIYTANIACLSCNDTVFDIYMKPLPVSNDLIAVMNTNEMNATEYTICLKVSDKAGNESLSIKQFTVNPSSGVYAYDNTIVPGSQALPDFPEIWLEDFIPEGSQTIDMWEWETDIRYSGTRSHTNPTKNGVHGHYFIRPDNPLYLSKEDNIVQYVYLSPEHPPLEILLQFYTDEGNGEHRAYWGENLIQTGGLLNSASLRFMGELPETGDWIRLIIPASQLDLADTKVRGIAYVAYNGKVWWDRTTKSSTIDDTGTDYQKVLQLSSDYHTSATIQYQVLQREHTTISVYQKETLIKTLVDAVKEPGNYQILWDWTDNNANAVSDGTYNVRMTSLSSDIDLGNISVQYITSRIRFPYENTLLAGKVPIIGTACAKDFDHFIVEYAPADNPDQWVLLNQSFQQAFDMNDWFTNNDQSNANLAIWSIDQSSMMGPHTIRLQVFNHKEDMKESAVKINVAKTVDANGAILKSNDNAFCLTIPENALSTEALVSIDALKWSTNFPIPDNFVAIGQPYIITASNFLLSKTAYLEMSYQQTGAIDEKTFRVYQWQPDHQMWTASNSTINTAQKKLVLNLTPDKCMTTAYAILSGPIDPPFLYEPVYSSGDQINLVGYSFPGASIEIFKNDSLLTSITADQINGLFSRVITVSDPTNTTFQIRTYDMEGNFSSFISKTIKNIPSYSLKSVVTFSNHLIVNESVNIKNIIQILQILSDYPNTKDSQVEFDYRNDRKLGIEEILYLFGP